MDTLKFFDSIGNYGRLIAIMCMAYCCRMLFDKVILFFAARYQELKQAFAERQFRKDLEVIREELPFENTVDDLMVFDKEESEKILAEMEYGYEWK